MLRALFVSVVLVTATTSAASDQVALSDLTTVTNGQVTATSLIYTEVLSGASRAVHGITPANLSKLVLGNVSAGSNITIGTSTISLTSTPNVLSITATSGNIVVGTINSLTTTTGTFSALNLGSSSGFVMATTGRLATTTLGVLTLSVGANGLQITATAGSPVISLPQDLTTAGTPAFAELTINGNETLTGNLTVSGNTTFTASPTSYSTVNVFRPNPPNLGSDNLDGIAFGVTSADTYLQRTGTGALRIANTSGASLSLGGTISTTGWRPAIKLIGGNTTYYTGAIQFFTQGSERMTIGAVDGGSASYIQGNMASSTRTNWNSPSTFTVDGSHGIKMTETAVSYAITQTDCTIVSTTSGSITLTLPTATSISTRIYDVVNAGGGTVTVTSSSTITGTTVVPTSSANRPSIRYHSNGSVWYAY